MKTNLTTEGVSGYPDMLHPDTLKTHRDILDRNLCAVENKLRILADRVAQERERLRHVPSVGNAHFTDVVAAVTHEVLWGVANLNLPNYTSNAAMADAELEQQRCRKRAIEESGL